MSTESESSENLPRRRASPEPPIEEDITPPTLQAAHEFVTEKVQLRRDRQTYKARVGRDRLVAALVGTVVLVGAGAVFTDRLDAETFLGSCFGALVGYFVRGVDKK